MSEITPQDLGSSLSVLNYLKNYAVESGNTQMDNIVTELLNQYSNVMETPDESNLTLLPYNRKDAYSILEYLKLQAEQLSDGKWTDFSDGDIGTVYLKILSYLADMNNFQTDKVVAELYLDTVTERSSAIALANLVGYEPRHYQSAYSEVTFGSTTSGSIPNGTIIPKFSTVTDAESTVIYSNIEQGVYYNDTCVLTMYEGTPVIKNYSIGDITSLGRINLSEYNVATNTIALTINGLEFKRVDDVRFINGELAFSVHITTDKYLYIQLPSYWTDLVTQSSVITLSFLVSNGSSGRIGKNVLTTINQLSSPARSYMVVESNKASESGYDPETVDELKLSIPKRARTMNTIVTINDFEEVGTDVLGIADISALDYNDPASGLVQPDDYYKVYLYVLPEAESYNALDSEQLKYRNTVIKDIKDWELEDFEKVAEGMDSYAVSSVSGTTITLSNVANLYSVTDIALAINTTTRHELLERVSNVSGITDRVVYTVSKSGNNIVISLNSNWKTLVSNTDKLEVYYKKEQILTDKGQALREYIDERRLASLQVTYHDLTIIQPTIEINVYMSKSNINYNTIDTQLVDFICSRYSRTNLKIGEPVFASRIGADILSNYPYIRYCEVVTPEEKIEPLPNGFVDIVPNVANSSGELVPKIIINVFDYQNRTI